jgi:hypothetical protein
MTIQDRVIQLLEQNGGRFDGTERLCLEAPASLTGVQKAVRKLKKHNIIRVRPNKGGAGRRTRYTLTQKGLAHVRSK